jgi:ubiquinone/menaquinone biosynthesis C-methylase UbiE
MATVTKPAVSFIRPDYFLRSLGIRGGQTLVQLGCGAGFYLIPAAKIIGRQGQVIGVDVRQDILREAENRAAQNNVIDVVRTVHADLEGDNFPVAPNIADWTLVVNILYQADPLKVLSKAFQVTKPGGRIVVVDWDTASSPLGPPLSDRIPVSKLLPLITSLRPKTIKDFRPSPFHYGFLLERSLNDS